MGRRTSQTSSARARRVTYRSSTDRDISTLVRHRHAMWREIGHRTEAEIAAHDALYRRWLRPRLRSGELVGVIAEARESLPVGSGCVWFRPDQPRPKIPKMEVPYILSMYTEAEWRGQGVASGIVRRLVAVCRERGYPNVVLHASEQGRSVYARLGFDRTWEMRYWIDPRLRRWRRAFGRSRVRRKRSGTKGLDRAR